MKKQLTPEQKTISELDEKLKVLPKYDRLEIECLIKLLRIDSYAKGEQSGIKQSFERMKTI